MLIPRIIHQVWAGPDPLPGRFSKWTESWVRHHPGWRYVLWTDATLFPLENQRQFDEMRDPVGRSDIARYEVVRRHGGVYCDMDYEALGCIEPLVSECGAFFATERQQDGQVPLTGSLFGATPGHPAIDRIVRMLPGYIATGTCLLGQVGPPVINEILEDEGGLLRLTPEQASPWAWWGPKGDPGAAVAAHHYSMSWKK